MNHHGLFLKLMQKQIPLKLLCILENWCKLCSTCIKWGSVVSRVFSVDCGVRQGGVLSPYLFALYIDSIVDRVRNSRIGCYLKGLCMSVLLYTYPYFVFAMLWWIKLCVNVSRLLTLTDWLTFWRLSDNFLINSYTLLHHGDFSTFHFVPPSFFLRYTSYVVLIFKSNH